MKKILLLQCFFLAAMWAAVAQVPFSKRYETTIKGNMIIVGNSMLNPGTYPANSAFNDRSKNNAHIKLDYADIDNDSNESDEE